MATLLRITLADAIRDFLFSPSNCTCDPTSNIIIPDLHHSFDIHFRLVSALCGTVEVSVIVGTLWEDLPEEKKEIFRAEARRLKEEHMVSWCPFGQHRDNDLPTQLILETIPGVQIYTSFKEACE